MNPVPWIRAFGALSLGALCLFFVSGFWLPLLAGAVAVVILAKLVR